MTKEEKVFPSCEQCGRYKYCFTSNYVKSICVLITSLLWPTDKKDWPFEPTEIKETFYRNIADHCKSITADDSQGT